MSRQLSTRDIPGHTRLKLRRQVRNHLAPRAAPFNPTALLPFPSPSFFVVCSAAPSRCETCLSLDPAPLSVSGTRDECIRLGAARIICMHAASPARLLHGLGVICPCSTAQPTPTSTCSGALSHSLVQSSTTGWKDPCTISLSLTLGGLATSGPGNQVGGFCD